MTFVVLIRFPGQARAFCYGHPGLSLIFNITTALHTDLPRKSCRGRSSNSSVVESQSYFVSERPFFQFQEQQAKIANEVHHLTRFFEKVDYLLPSCLMMLIRQLLEIKNGCKLTKNPIQTMLEPLL